MQRQRVEIFKKVFCSQVEVATALIKKLIAVTESIEKLPIYLYDNSVNSGYGLQILTRRLRFRLERAPGKNLNFRATFSWSVLNFMLKLS